MQSTLNTAKKTVIRLDLAMVECLLDGEAVEFENVTIVPSDDLIAAHERSVRLHNLRSVEPEFHL